MMNLGNAFWYKWVSHWLSALLCHWSLSLEEMYDAPFKNELLILSLQTGFGWSSAVDLLLVYLRPWVWFPHCKMSQKLALFACRLRRLAHLIAVCIGDRLALAAIYKAAASVGWEIRNIPFLESVGLNICIDQGLKAAGWPWGRDAGTGSTSLPWNLNSKYSVTYNLLSTWAFSDCWIQ